MLALIIAFTTYSVSCWFRMLGSVLCSRCLVSGAWLQVLGSGCLVLCAWFRLTEYKVICHFVFNWLILSYLYVVFFFIEYFPSYLLYLIPPRWIVPSLLSYVFDSHSMLALIIAFTTYPVSCWFRMLGSGCLVPGAWFQVLGSRCFVPGAWSRMLGLECLIPGARFRVLGSLCLVPVDRI